MPSLTFVLPHWMYWGGLAVFPLMAMWLVRREEERGPGSGISLPIAYLFWLASGFVGIHRLYLKNWWGVIYIPLFIAILFGNVQGRAARESVSSGHSEVQIASFNLELAQEAVKQKAEGAQEKLAAAQQGLVQAQAGLTQDTADYDYWQTIVGILAGVTAVLLLIDAFLLPGMVRRCAAAEAREGAKPHEIPPEPYEIGTHEAPDLKVHTRFTDVIDKIDGLVGEFVGYWSLIAVFVYYYEVLARYVFNSPTNWAHESMFLMFGMQYLLSGAFALRDDAHVRVDVVYVMLPPRAQAFLDIITSVFFFLFTGVMLVTGLVFADNAIGLWETSFTEWGIQYWPVKLAIPIGAFLIMVQGITKLLKDIVFFTAKEA